MIPADSYQQIAIDACKVILNLGRPDLADILFTRIETLMGPNE